MRKKARAPEDFAAGLDGSAPWSVIRVEVLPGYQLQVWFADGTDGIVDASKLVLGANPGVFEALRDPRAFAQVSIEHGAVTWPGDLDLAPDAMHDEIVAHGRWDIPE